MELVDLDDRQHIYCLAELVSANLPGAYCEGGTVRLDFIREEDLYTLSVSEGRNTRAFKCSSHIDFEDCLVALRKTLESEGLSLLIARYALNAFVSPFLRQNSVGLACYLIDPRRPVSPDLIERSAGPIRRWQYGTQEENEQFITHWIAQQNQTWILRVARRWQDELRVSLTVLLALGSAFFALSGGRSAFRNGHWIPVSVLSLLVVLLNSATLIVSLFSHTARSKERAVAE